MLCISSPNCSCSDTSLEPSPQRPRVRPHGLHQVQTDPMHPIHANGDLWSGGHKQLQGLAEADAGGSVPTSAIVLAPCGGGLVYRQQKALQ